MKDEGVKKLYVLNDKQVYGAGVAKNTEAAAEPAGIKVVGNDGWDGKAPNYRALASKIKASGADAVFFGRHHRATTAPSCTRTSARRCPNAKLFGPDGVADDDVHEGDPGRRPGPDVPDGSDRVAGGATRPTARSSTRTTRPRTATKPDESTRTRSTATRRWPDVLDAIAQGRRRPPGRHRRVLRDQGQARACSGTYEIDKDGDTTLTTYGAYLVKDGKLVFDKVIKAQRLSCKSLRRRRGPARPAPGRFEHELMEAASPQPVAAGVARARRRRGHLASTA